MYQTTKKLLVKGIKKTATVLKKIPTTMWVMLCMLTFTTATVLKKIPATVWVVLCMLTFTLVANASDPFATAAGKVEGYKGGVQTLCRTIAAVIAIVGAFNVYFKMQNGDQDMKKTIMMVIGGCIAFVVLAEALPAMLA